MLKQYLSKKPKETTTDEVIQWFTPFALVRNVNTIESHIVSLTKEWDNLVNDWKQLYMYCLYDIGYGAETSNKDYENVKNLLKFNPYRLKVTSDEFQIKTSKTDEELNKMTKKDFVLLFAKTMDEILKLKEDKHEKETEKKTEAENYTYRISRQEYIEKWCKDNPGSCIEDKNGNLVPNIDITGGKSKKSKKKSRKRNASKRRNRRTRNYKKK